MSPRAHWNSLLHSYDAIPLIPITNLPLITVWHRDLDMAEMTAPMHHSLASSQERERHLLLLPVTQPPPAENCTYGQSTVAQEKGRHMSSELAFVPHQPPPAVMNRFPQHTMDCTSPRNPSAAAPQRCRRDCTPSSSFVGIRFASTVDDSTAHDYNCSGCQLHTRLTKVPVQESLRGYYGPSALV